LSPAPELTRIASSTACSRSGGHVFFEELTQRLCELRALAPPVYEANAFIEGVTRFDLAFRSR
jgi:hypothetical protein